MSRSTVLQVLLFVFVSAAAFPVLAGAPGIDWEKIYGDSSVDIGMWIEEHSSGGYIVSGRWDPGNTGQQDAFLMRLDASGDTLWAESYGDSLEDAALCVREVSGGGYILVGYKERIPGNVDAWFIRTDQDGDTLWTSSFELGADEFLYCVVEDPDGGFVATGFTSSAASPLSTDILLIKVDANGAGKWKEIYGGPGHNRGYGICPASGGDYIIVGYTEVGSDRGDMLLLKIDGSNADSVWARTYGDTTDDRGRSICETADGGFLAGGALSNMAAGWSRAYLVRTDDKGDTLWTKRWGGPGDQQTISSVAETPDLGFICCGYKDTSSTGDSDFHFIKTDSKGDTLWTKAFGGVERESAGCVIVTSDLGYAAAGYKRSLPGSDYNIYVAKLLVDEAGIPAASRHPAPGMLSVEGASPFRRNVTVKYHLTAPGSVRLAVYDALGRHVTTLAEGVRPAGIHLVDWDCGSSGRGKIASGFYFISLRTGEGGEVRKILVLK